MSLEERGCWKRSAGDLDFQLRLEACAIPAEAFGHREHLQLAYVYLAVEGPEAALGRLRASLQTFLKHHKVDPAKYHETVTQAWILAVHHFMHRSGPTESFEQFIEASAELLDVKVMQSHYSREHMDSERARQEFVEPDRDPIPRH